MLFITTREKKLEKHEDPEKPKQQWRKKTIIETNAKMGRAKNANRYTQIHFRIVWRYLTPYDLSVFSNPESIYIDLENALKLMDTAHSDSRQNSS